MVAVAQEHFPGWPRCRIRSPAATKLALRRVPSSGALLCLDLMLVAGCVGDATPLPQRLRRAGAPVAVPAPPPPCTAVLGVSADTA